MSFPDASLRNEVFEQREQIQMMSEALRKYKLYFEKDKGLRAALATAKTQIEELSSAVQVIDQLKATLQQLRLQIQDYEGKINAVKRERDMLSVYCEERSKMIAQAAQTLYRHAQYLKSKEHRIATLERENFELHSLISELQTQLQAALQNQTAAQAVYFSQLQQTLRDRWKASSSYPEKSHVAEQIDDFLQMAASQEREAFDFARPADIINSIDEDKHLQELETALRRSQAYTTAVPREQFFAVVAPARLDSGKEYSQADQCVQETLPYSAETPFFATQYMNARPNFAGQQYVDSKMYAYTQPLALPETCNTNQAPSQHFSYIDSCIESYQQTNYPNASQATIAATAKSTADDAYSGNQLKIHQNEGQDVKDATDVSKRTIIEKHMRICNSVESEQLYSEDYQLMLDTDMLISRMQAKTHSSIGLSRRPKDAEYRHLNSACCSAAPLAQPRCIRPGKGEMEEPKYQNLAPTASTVTTYLLLTAVPPHEVYHSRSANYVTKDSYTSNQLSDTTMVKIFRTKQSMRKSVDYENSVDNEEECIEAQQLIGENYVLQQELLLAKAQIAALSQSAQK